jgi:hypothetical protein
VKPDFDQSAFMSASPNPSVEAFDFRYSWESSDENPVVEVSNLMGQVIYTERLASKTGITTFGNTWKPGVYFAALRSAGRSSVAVKLVKQ